MSLSGNLINILNSNVTSLLYIPNKRTLALLMKNYFHDLSIIYIITLTLFLLL